MLDAGVLRSALGVSELVVLREENADNSNVSKGMKATSQASKAEALQAAPYTYTRGVKHVAVACVRGLRIIVPGVTVPMRGQQFVLACTLT